MDGQRKNVAAKLFLFLFLTLIISGLTGGYLKDDAISRTSIDDPGSNEVFMEDDTFDPEKLTVAKGTTVKWINKEDEPHDVVSGEEDSPSGLFNSGKMKENGVFTFKFTEAGTFPYYCSRHEGMTGTIVVK